MSKKVTLAKIFNDYSTTNMLDSIISYTLDNARESGFITYFSKGMQQVISSQLVEGKAHPVDLNAADADVIDHFPILTWHTHPRKKEPMEKLFQDVISGTGHNISQADLVAAYIHCLRTTREIDSMLEMEADPDMAVGFSDYFSRIIRPIDIAVIPDKYTATLHLYQFRILPDTLVSRASHSPAYEPTSLEQKGFLNQDSVMFDREEERYLGLDEVLEKFAIGF